MMRRTLPAASSIIACATVLLTTAVPSGWAASQELAEARGAGARFTDVASAQASGYELLLDADGIACIDSAAGGMGIHYVNVGLVLDPTLDPATPEVLVYEPDMRDNLRLVAVEYVIFDEDWSSDDPPTLFGEHFHRMPGAGEAEPQNRYGLPAFFELHAWVGKHNPSGMFADWNPRVTC